MIVYVSAHSTFGQYKYICSGYKHFTLIDEKTSLPVSVRGAHIATTAPFLNIWCLQYFPLIQRIRHIYINSAAAKGGLRGGYPYPR